MSGPPPTSTIEELGDLPAPAAGAAPRAPRRHACWRRPPPSPRFLGILAIYLAERASVVAEGDAGSPTGALALTTPAT